MTNAKVEQNPTKRAILENWIQCLRTEDQTKKDFSKILIGNKEPILT